MDEGKAASTTAKAHTWQSGSKNGKLGLPGPATQPPKCPECASQKVWKDGLRYTRQGEVQRWLCRSCGYRFSEPKIKVNIGREQPKGSNHVPDPSDIHTVNFLPVKKRLNNFSLPISENVSSQYASPTLISTARKFLNTSYPNSKDCRVCATEKEAKNLAEEATRQKWAAGATKVDKATIKGKIVEFAWWMKRQGYANSTVKVAARLLKHLVKEGANLFDPESIKDVIASHEDWNNSYKHNLVHTYNKFTEMLGIRWIPPRYKRTQTLPFIPLEKEIDQLIAGCGKKVAVSLQLLKETGMRIGEAWQLRWIDIDEERRTIRCKPEKHGDPRMFKVSAKLIAMLKALPKTSDLVFGNTSLIAHRWNFTKQRKHVAQKLQNPRIQKITFHTLRHWKATMEYHRTKDILHVKQLLGHKSINATLIYTQLIQFENDEEYYVRVAKTVKEACELAKVGFEKFTEIDGVQIFRKRK